MPDTPEELRDWLRALKDQSGLSSREIANAIGEDMRNITRWLSPTKPVTPDGLALLKTLSALGVGFDPPAPTAVRAVNREIADLRKTIDRLDRRLGEALDLRVRLGSLEEGRGLVTESLEAIEARLAEIDARLPGRADRAQ